MKALGYMVVWESTNIRWIFNRSFGSLCLRIPLQPSTSTHWHWDKIRQI